MSIILPRRAVFTGLFATLTTKALGDTLPKVPEFALYPDTLLNLQSGPPPRGATELLEMMDAEEEKRAMLPVRALFDPDYLKQPYGASPAPEMADDDAPPSRPSTPDSAGPDMAESDVPAKVPTPTPRPAAPKSKKTPPETAVAEATPRREHGRRQRAAKKDSKAKVEPADQEADEKPGINLFNVFRGSAAGIVLTLSNANTGETIKLDTGNLSRQKEKLNHFGRDWRQNREIDIDDQLVSYLAECAKISGVRAFNAFSWYRTKETIALLGGVGGSQHKYGRACDLVPVGMSAAAFHKVALQVTQRHGHGGVGFYPYSDTPFVHLDARPGSLARWLQAAPKKLKKSKKLAAAAPKP